MSELIKYSLSLNTEYPGYEKQVNIIQGEVEARMIDVTLTKDSKRLVLNKATDMAMIRGLKSDKTVAFNSALITENGTVQYVFTEKDAAVSGVGYYEILVIRFNSENEKDIGVRYTARFKLNVGESLYNDEMVTSGNEYTALVNSLVKAEKSLDNMYVETEYEVTWNTSIEAPRATSTSNYIYCDRLKVKQTGYYSMSIIEYDSNGNIVKSKKVDEGIVCDYQVGEGNYMQMAVAQVASTEDDISFDSLELKFYKYQKNYFVPMARKIADFNLEKDIEGTALGLKLIELVGQNSNFGEAVIYHMLMSANTYFGKEEVSKAFGTNATNLFGLNADKIFDTSGVQIALKNMFYTKEETDNNYVPSTREVAGYKLSGDISLGQMAQALTSKTEGLFSRNDFIENTRTMIKEYPEIIQMANDIVTATNIAKGAQYATSANDYQGLIIKLNNAPEDKFKLGDNIYINTLDVPDVWVSYVSSGKVEYTYSTDEDFVNDLKRSSTGVQVGHYYLCPLETGKVDLSDYAKKSIKVVGKELTSDITENDIINSIKNATNFWIAVYNAMATGTNVSNYFADENVISAINNNFYKNTEIDKFIEDKADKNVWRKLNEFTIEEATDLVICSEDSDGNQFSIDEAVVILSDINVNATGGNIIVGIFPVDTNVNTFSGVLTFANGWTAANIGSNCKLRIKNTEGLMEGIIYYGSGGSIRSNIGERTKSIDGPQKIVISTSMEAESIGPGTKFTFYGKDRG